MKLHAILYKTRDEDDTIIGEIHQHKISGVQYIEVIPAERVNKLIDMILANVDDDEFQSVEYIKRCVADFKGE